VTTTASDIPTVSNDADRLNKLLRLCSPIDIKGSLSDKSASLLKRLKDLIPFDGATVHLVSRVSRRLEELVSVGRRVQFLSYLSLGSGLGLEGWVAANRRPTRIPLRKKDFLSEPDGHYRSILSIPLLYGEELVGVVNLGCFAADIYDDEKLRMAEMVAGPLGVSLQMLQLDEELNRTRAEVQQHSTGERNVLSGANLMVRLREAARLAASVNHEINNPLAVIVGNIQCLVMEKSAVSQKELSRMRRIEAAALRVSKANRRLSGICSLVEAMDRCVETEDKD